MAHDLYRKKDKMDLAKTNPRTHNFGAMSSCDMQYKNYLVGMKPRSTVREGDPAEVQRSAPNNFRVTSNQDVNDEWKEDTDQIITNRSPYTEISSVPAKKTNTFSFERGKENPRCKTDRVKAKSNSFDEEVTNLRNESTVSVGKLCSMFDNKPKLRNTNNIDADRKRDNLKRFSALEPMQRSKHDDKKVDESEGSSMKPTIVDTMMTINNESNENELSRCNSPKMTLIVDAMLNVDKSVNNVTVTNSMECETTDYKNNCTELVPKSTISLSKTKGMHGLLQRKGSEFDDFEDRIIPTGSKTIDISSLLAPSSADDNNNHNENIPEIENEQSVSGEFDLQKKRELDRLMQAQQEVNIHKAFNIKRRSLKDKLSEMYSMNQDSFDHGVVPYESVSQLMEQSPINISSYSEQDTPKISSVNDTDDKQCEIINEPIGTCDSENIMCYMSEVVDFNVTLLNDANKNNDSSVVICSEAITKNNISNIYDESQNGIHVELPDKVHTEANIETVSLEEAADVTTSVTLDVENVDIITSNENHNVVTQKIDLSDINKMKILLNDPVGSESDNDSDEMPPDKPYESIVERFDAFLTNHGHGIAEIDPDILLPPAPIPPAEVDVKLLTAAILDSYELETSVVGLADAELSEPFLVDDDIPHDTCMSDNLSIANEKVCPNISDDLSLFEEKISNSVPGDISLADEVTNFHPFVHSADPPNMDANNTSMNYVDQNFENERLIKSENDNLTDISAHVKLKLPCLPNLCKQEKLDFVIPKEDSRASFDVEASQESLPPQKLADATVGNEIFSQVSASVDHVGLDVNGEFNILNKCDHEQDDKTIANSLHVESGVATSETVAILSDIKEDIWSDNHIIRGNNLNTSGEIAQPSNLEEVVSTQNVTPVENVVEERINVTSSNHESVHQVLGANDKVLSAAIPTNITITTEEQKPFIDRNGEENVCSISINNREVSSTSDNDYKYQVTRSRKSQVHILPKKSNLIKSKISGHKKVNFKDPLSNDVILTYGPMEYDRANADIDPIASSAEWELEKRVDKMDVFSVDLQKDERGLGLSIIGLGVGTETGVEKLGIFVKTLTENGASQRDGRIQVNDQILEVNGVSLVGVTQYFAAQTLKNTDGVVRFLMGREKSRRTQYSPGAPLAGNPEMHKHIEEMNQVLQQLEEFEDRAINAESTLEDVKVELLKAEEHAHGVEQQLKDSKEQLAAATESPFIGTTKKLKNEIKKKGGKQEKLDTLQQSLVQVTNKLSTSEDNLTELQNQNEEKGIQIVVLQQRISDFENQMEQMENSSKYLHNEIGGKNDEINSAKRENVQLKEELNEISEKYDKEKENLACLQAEMVAKVGADMEDKQKVKELQSENESLKDKVHALTQKLEMNEKLESCGEDHNVKHLEDKVNRYKTELETSNANMVMMKEKNAYLQSLIVKLETREELAPEKINIEQKFREKEEEYIKENDALRGKITELEQQLHFPKTMMSNELSPALPIRGYVNIKELNQPVEPPEISRNTKPCAKIEPNTQVQNTFNHVSKFEEDTNFISNDGAVESLNGIDDIDIYLSMEGNHDNGLHDIEDGSLNTNTNPVPKPERGNFISIDQDIKLHPRDTNLKDMCDEPSELLYPIQGKTIEQLVTGGVFVSSSVNGLGAISSNTESLQENIWVDGHNSMVPTNENFSKISSALSIDLDDLPEGKIDNESDEDQGQFQLIHEEDIEEEQQMPAPTNRTLRLHSDVTDNRIPLNSDLTGSLISDSSFDKWLGRLDATSREAHADMIAAQVAAGAPNMRKYSNTSSTSSEEAADMNTAKNDVVHIDSLYLEKSAQHDASFDVPIDEADKAMDDNGVMMSENPNLDVTGGDLKKCASLDMAIPPTPVLENKGALDKKAVMNNRRTKPSRSPRVAVATEISVCEADGSVTTCTSTLPRHVHKPVAKIKAAQSVPNLSMVPESDKVSKRKHKYVFYLPKAFKKTKLGKRLSQDSFNKKNEDSTPSLSDTDIAPVPLTRTSSDIDMHSYTPSLNLEAAVVPMAEKAASLNQEKANDAATEEAVVPFADKEMLMKGRSSDTDLHEPSSEKSSLSTSPPSPLTSSSIPLEPSPSLSSTRSFSNSHHDNKLNGQGINSPPLPSSTNGTLEYEFSSYTASPVGSMSPEIYNERGIDVEMSNAEDTSYKTLQVTHWDAKQVSQWLTEINMSEYANSFKVHNVNGSLLLKADGRDLKEYGVHNHEHRSQIKKYIKEFRMRYGWQKSKDHKSTKDKLQFWKGKYKLN